jgi:hypothetical protein
VGGQAQECEGGIEDLGRRGDVRPQPPSPVWPRRRISRAAVDVSAAPYRSVAGVEDEGAGILALSLLERRMVGEVLPVRRDEDATATTVARTFRR